MLRVEGQLRLFNRQFMPPGLGNITDLIFGHKNENRLLDATGWGFWMVNGRAKKSRQFLVGFSAEDKVASQETINASTSISHCNRRQLVIWENGGRLLWF